MNNNEYKNKLVQFMSDCTVAARAEFPELIDTYYNKRRVPVVIRQIDFVALLDKALKAIPHKPSLFCECEACDWKRVKADEFYLQYNKPSHILRKHP